MSESWSNLLSSVVDHPDAHLLKTMRAFRTFDRLYGNIPSGHFSDSNLLNAGMLDGSLFGRVAAMTADRFLKVEQASEAQSWDRRCYLD